MAAPALAASSADCAISSGVTGTAGFLATVSAEPVTAQVTMTLRAMLSPLPLRVAGATNPYRDDGTNGPGLRPPDRSGASPRCRAAPLSCARTLAPRHAGD